MALSVINPLYDLMIFNHHCGLTKDNQFSQFFRVGKNDIKGLLKDLLDDNFQMSKIEYLMTQTPLHKKSIFGGHCQKVPPMNFFGL